MSTRHFDLGIHVDISTLSILLDIETRHGEEEEQIFIAKQMDDMGRGAPTPDMEKKGMIVRERERERERELIHVLGTTLETIDHF